MAEGSFGISIWNLTDYNQPIKVSSKILHGTAYRVAINKVFN